MSALRAMVLAASTCAACATTQRASQPGPAPDPRAVRIFHGDNGAPATWDALIGAAASTDVLFLGENHGHPLGLSVAAAIFEDLVHRAPDASLALEFIERDDQSRLDDYLRGVVELDVFEKRAGRTAGNFPPGHRAMVETAKQHQRPVRAANAPRQYVRLASRQGFEPLKRLTEEQQRLFKIPEQLIGGRYREAFDRVMTPAGRDPNAPDERLRLDDVFRSQQIWDWTMADALASGLRAGQAPIAMVIGRFHSDFEGGTPQALALLRPGTRYQLVSFAPAWSDVLAEDDRHRADFVIYVGPSPESH
jgi:uncharacterized iron-regulated protein